MRYFLKNFRLIIALAFMGIVPVFFVLKRSVPLTETLGIYVSAYVLLTPGAIIGGLLGRLRDQTFGGALLGVLLWYFAISLYNSALNSIR